MADLILPFTKCSVDDCPKNAHSKSRGILGYCKNHYQNSLKKRNNNPFVKCKIQDCNNNSHYRSSGAKGLCSKHYSRLKNNGNPNIIKTIPYGSVLSFLEEVIRSEKEGCIFSPYGRSANGYVEVSINGVKTYGHRYVLTTIAGPPPSKKHYACHKCGNGHLGCVSPFCLYWGTPKDNMQDAILHGTTTRGTKNSQAKLTNDNVLKIYNDNRPRISIAKDYPVNIKAISDIKNGKKWGWLTGKTYSPNNLKRKLTEKEIISIFNDTRKPSVIAKYYGIDSSSISRIKSGKSWRNVTGKA